ncbi:hypothetical protein [Aurantimonas endophytica]|uniref:Uncharacterized protein n=1 Tax=Aurantimonas endophytica TaxID=1522175 RepID=A0A7W6MQ31_9HYPH|nr:hypothetical protein [Aurantimonas endophytica]MBB4003512.1 hypothetical protein [Aurantimonas endophytica]MCO6404371.1 hypothetical protein [Aurantimonas endophytica]
MVRFAALALASASLAAAASAPAMAQDAPARQSFAACTTQQDLEQILNSDGQLMPDGCRSLSITPVRSENGTLCVIDFSGESQGVLQNLRDAASPDQWWVQCDSLTENAG